MPGHPAKFTVTNLDGTRPPPVHINVEGPSKVRLAHRDTAEGYEFTYIVTAEGEYHVSIMFGAEIHIPGSPFRPKLSSESESPVNSQLNFIKDNCSSMKLNRMTVLCPIIPATT